MVERGETMKKQGISQEALKLAACLTMLIDHIGATLVLQQWYSSWDPSVLNLYYVLRVIGRIAFPIYCFLLVEGAHYTRDPKKYGIRLAIGMVLSELPFDLAFNEGLDWASNSVMVTLLLGFLMIEAMKRVKGFWKVVLILPFFLAAEWMGTDYGGNGILIIAMLALTKGVKHEKLWRTVGFVCLLSFGAEIQIGSLWVPIELFGLLSLPLIFCYSGKKLTRNKAVQWAFYLFYPVHLTILWILETVIYG